MPRSPARRVLHAWLLLFLIVVAGCTTQPAPTAAPSTTERPAATETGSPISSAAVIEYRNLEADARRLFDRSRTLGAVTLDAAELPRQLREYDAVRFEVQRYRLSIEAGMRATYELAPERVDSGAVPDDRTPANISNLSSEAQSVIRQAIESGEYESDERPYPEFFGVQYVRYEGDIYDLFALHSDVPLVELSVTVENR